MIIECSYCRARVDAKILAQYTDPPDEEIGLHYRVTLVVCPTCGNSLVAGQSQETPGQVDGSHWEMPVRVWPSPDSHFSWRIPVIARGSLEEAAKCFKVGAYSACAVMCGRALEGICRHYKTRSTNLAGSLKELLDQGIIDGRLFEWSEALKSLRNIGAHATGVAVSEQDARDLLDFANAICEYIFVLAAKFEEFMERRRTNGEKKV